MPHEPAFTGAITDSLAEELSADTLAEHGDVSDVEPEQTPEPDPDDTFDIFFHPDDADDPDEVEEDSAPSRPAMAFGAMATFAARPMGLVGGASDAFPGRKAFRLGRSHPAVTRLGEMLIGRGGKRFYSVGAGPKFGVADRNACAAFQRAQGWGDSGADGYPGPKTWELLVEGEGKNIGKGGGPLRSPVPGYKATYAYGVKNRSYAAGFHTGADFAAPSGSPIVSVVAGKVIRADWGGAYGKWTLVKGADGHVWLYAHQSRRAVKAGQKVKSGQVIGYVGTTGNSTGPHLHLEKSRGPQWAYGQVVKPSW